MAGVKKTKSKGAMEKKALSDACPPRNKVPKYSQPATKRKPDSTM